MRDDTQPVPQKAGIILFGTEKPEKSENGHFSQRTLVLASYSEGRFVDGYKAYAPAKGSIDEGEDPRSAAVRETYEETGIDIKRLLGEQAFSRWSKGEDINDVESLGYAGVRVICAKGSPVTDHTYISGHGKKHTARYFSIEVEGISKLRPHLKKLMPEISDTGHTIGKTAASLRESNKLPTHDELVDILMKGRVPASLRERDKRFDDSVVIASPVLPGLLSIWKNKVPTADLSKIRDWKKFCKHTEGFSRLSDNLELLKNYLFERSIISDHGASLKMDIRDKPLNFYMEGGAILPVGELISQMSDMARRSRLYARAMWGEYNGKKRPNPTELDMAMQAQISPLLLFFKDICPMELGFAATLGDRKSPQLDPRAMRSFAGAHR